MSVELAKLKWYWTSYRRDYSDAYLPGQKVGDRKCYIGCFYAEDGLPCFWRSTIRFWAHRPVLALREIVQSGKHPREFTDTLVN